MEIIDKKIFDYSDKNWQTCFLVNKFIDITSKKNVLFNLPNNMCFSFGLKEIVSICEVTEEINNRAYFYLVNSFYDYLKKDTIFRKIDEFAYINLMREIKEISENREKINVYNVKNHMEKTYKIYYKKYLSELQKEIKKIINGIEISKEDLDFLSDLFINELLSMGYTYKYLNYIFNYFFYENNKNNTFNDLNDLIDFLFNKTSDTFDMFLPIKNISSRDIEFVKNQFSEQKIVKGEEILLENRYGFEVEKEIYYCHIYFKSNDYFRCIEDQLNRVNSIFNILKFYTNSQISLDFDSKPFIYSKKIGIINRSSIKSMLQYSYFQGTTNVIETVNEVFDNLNENHNPILMDIYDIMNYSQKNHDIFSNDQFLSKWISIESCASKGLRKKGFDAVLEYVTKSLSLSFYRQKITRVLKNSGLNYSLESFVKNYNKTSFNSRKSKVKNIYFRYIIDKYVDIFSNDLKIYESIINYQEQLKYMLYRIYIMRNKYVHSGNTLNNNDMLRYYLNIIEPFFLDKVLKTLNTLVLNEIAEYDKVTWNDIFDEIDFQYDLLYNSLLLMKEPLRISKTSNIKLSDVVDDKKRGNLIINLLVEHSRNMNIVKADSRYSEEDDIEEIIIDE